MGVQDILSVVAGLLFIAGFIPYIRAILVGTTKPAKASWIIWASLDTITIVGMCVQNSLNGQIIGAVIGAWIVALLALKYGASGWTWLDKFCITGAVLGIILWQLFSSPTLGIITSLTVVFLGSIPTFVSAWKDPSRENKTGWTIFWLSCICAVMAIPKLTLDDASQPIVFLLIETIMMCLLFIKPCIVKFQQRQELAEADTSQTKTS